MKSTITLLLVLFFSTLIISQDLSMGLMVNDLTLRPMQPIAKPAYLGTITDPSFGTTIRRISNAANGENIVPMYSTVQPWNADESLMIIYKIGRGHQLLDGRTYQFIRYLDDINPDDLENIFWDFDDPSFFYYLDAPTDNFIKYNAYTQSKTTIVNFNTITNNCSGPFYVGSAVQMTSWDSNVISFRCGNDYAYTYNISAGILTQFNMPNVDYAPPMPAPSGQLFYHDRKVYNANGDLHLNLNQNNPEHDCIGKLGNGNDGYYAVAFEEGPSGGCIGNLIAHDLTTGECFPIISQGQGYDYPLSETHISAITHKNTQGGWVSISMIGYDKDGQSLLDQELAIARIDEQGNPIVCRIGHHRSDEDDYNYWGEPHAAISPTGTRVLFGSDWSGAEDGQSIDAYVVELPSYDATILAIDEAALQLKAEVVHDEIWLKWETILSPNHAYFEIEHSINGVDFRTIGKNDAQGNSFSFKHQHPQKGTNHYRLKQIDSDNNFDYTKIITIDFTTKNTLFKYNSTTKELTFVNFSQGQIFIYAADGRLVFHQKNKSENTVLDFLQSGIYTIQVIENGKIEAEKIAVF